MDLKYQISKKTNLDAETLTQRIVLRLKEENYNIINFTGNSVVFDDYTGNILTSRMESFGKFTNGKFKIEYGPTNNTVNFESLLISLSELFITAVVVSAFVVFAIINADQFLYIGALFFSLQLTFRYFNLRAKANQLLSAILVNVNGSESKAISNSSHD